MLIAELAKRDRETTDYFVGLVVSHQEQIEQYLLTKAGNTSIRNAQVLAISEDAPASLLAGQPVQLSQVHSHNIHVSYNARSMLKESLAKLLDASVTHSFTKDDTNNKAAASVTYSVHWH